MPHKQWPHDFGFEIYGNGPCYVIFVEKGSIAHKAHLMPGDQLLEVNGSDVTNMTAEQIKALVKSESNQAPELEVVSCLKTHVIKPYPHTGYGFKISKKKPVTVVKVEYGGPAYNSRLRVGDVILEANGCATRDAKILSTILSQQTGKLTLLAIPVARTSNLLQVDKTLTKVKAPDPRHFRAKDLHNKLESVMGNDNKRKMAVVKALKQYAEDRDIIILCSALNDLLTTKSHRQVLKNIRLLIPPAQRPQFDDLVNFKSLVDSPPGSNPSSGIIRVAHFMGRRKIIQVVREEGSFGFVIKSGSPACVESVDPGSAAERAGILSGDYLIKLNGIDIRKCNYDRLVKLLQDSGTAPTLEILRCAKAENNAIAHSATSSSSSHNSDDNILFTNEIKDKDNNTFTEKANFLLTPTEWKILKRSIKTYDMNRDIKEFYNSVSAILDTPSKKMLWPYLFVVLTTQHREYVTHHVSMPSEVLLNIVKSNFEPESSDSEEEEAETPDSGLNDLSPSFKQHIDFLLTSKERLQFMQCLKTYNTDQDLSSLVTTLESLLDTPSKKTLWKLVMPHLNTGHREVVKGRLPLNDKKTVETVMSQSSTTVDSYASPPANAQVASTENDILYGRSQVHFHSSIESSSDESQSTEYSSSSVINRNQMETKLKPRSNNDMLMKELEETKKIMQDVKNALLAQERNKAHEDNLDPMISDKAETQDEQNYVTIIPVGYPGLEHDKLPFYSRQMNSAQLSSLKESIKFPVATEMRGAVSSLHDIPHSSFANSSSDDDSDKGMEVGYDLIESKYSKQSSIAQRPHKHTADEPAIHETSYGESPPNSITFKSPEIVREVDETVMGYSNSVHSQVPLPPLPPPLPPALPEGGVGAQESGDRMTVKRINWEKLDNKSVQNTIWEKLSDTDLSDMIEYLELETQFSTKQSLQNNDKKKEVLIMDRKKAYNISILLGHLKMPVEDVKKALYSMDDKILSSDLLGQLLAFAPDEHEITQYRAYEGDISLLTKPDQFTYQMSLITDYKERLTALRFKASFKEKVEEIRKNLEYIRTASLELRNSKTLAHILEIILAMGNYMNKGNPRIGEAAGFRITFLTQLDVTKTADKKSSFLHVLADAAYKKFPETLTLAEELSTVDKASKVSIQVLIMDIQELQRGLQETSKAFDYIRKHSRNVEPEELMGHFIAEATDEIQSTTNLQKNALEEFSKTVTFFGEDPKILTASDVFGIISEFIKNFEKAHHHNLMFKRQ